MNVLLAYLVARVAISARRCLDGKTGAPVWCGHGAFAHSLVKISDLAS